MYNREEKLNEKAMKGIVDEISKLSEEFQSNTCKSGLLLAGLLSYIEIDNIVYKARNPFKNSNDIRYCNENGKRTVFVKETIGQCRTLSLMKYINDFEEEAGIKIEVEVIKDKIEKLSVGEIPCNTSLIYVCDIVFANGRCIKNIEGLGKQYPVMLIIEDNVCTLTVHSQCENLQIVFDTIIRLKDHMKSNLIVKIIAN